MQPIVFDLAEVRNRQGGQKRGVGPSWQGALPLPQAYYVISGVTKDSAGVALPGCTVHLFRTADDTEADMVTSDAGGYYEFRSPGPAENYYAVAYLAGAPDVAGTTVNTLVGV